MRGQQTRARLLPWTRPCRAGGRGWPAPPLALRAREVKNQCAVGNVLDVLHQPCHHLGGVGRHSWGRPAWEPRSACLVARSRTGWPLPGSGNICSALGALAGGRNQTNRNWSVGRCHHSTAHLAPQELAQQVARHNRAGMGGHGENHWRCPPQPLGQGCSPCSSRSCAVVTTLDDVVPARTVGHSGQRSLPPGWGLPWQWT